MSHHRPITPALWGLVAIALSGCLDHSGWDGQLDQPDMVSFEAEVYPVLLRDCGFPTCHGDPRRFLLVMGPGRTRWSPELKNEDPPDPREVQLSYERTRSMLATAGTAQESLLLLKPLSTRAGGAAHKGTDALGRGVYQSADEAGYQALLQWAQAVTTPLTTPAPTATVIP